jgi:PQQ-dependent catabolism-associated CXXCW motif protein
MKPGRDALFLDVLPAEGAHRDDDGNWHLARPHETISGSHWFPEVGRGEPEPDLARWFEASVHRLTGGNRDRMLIVFCLTDCWMSWNAAKRLRAIGYRNVWWLAEGTDGWREQGLSLVGSVPFGSRKKP